MSTYHASQYMGMSSNKTNWLPFSPGLIASLCRILSKKLTTKYLHWDIVPSQYSCSLDYCSHILIFKNELSIFFNNRHSIPLMPQWNMLAALLWILEWQQNIPLNWLWHKQVTCQWRFFELLGQFQEVPQPHIWTNQDCSARPQFGFPVCLTPYGSLGSRNC